MKRIIYLCVCLIGFAGLFTSCINQVEPEGLKTLREGKAAYYQALANLQTANSDKIEADAAYEKAMAVADAAYQTAQAALLNAQAGLITAQAEYVKAQTAAQVEATRHAAEMNQISEEVAKARAQAAEAEAAYWKAYYEDATSLLAAQLKVAMEQAQYQLDSVKAAETALAQQNEEDSLAHALEVANAKAALEQAEVANEAALDQTKAALATAKQNLAQAEEDLRVALANIEAQKGLLTSVQQGQLDHLMDVYESASNVYNQSQYALLSAKSELVKMVQDYNESVAETASDRTKAIEGFQSDIAEKQAMIEEFNGEVDSWTNALSSNEMFQGIPINEWIAVLGTYRVKDSVQRVAIAKAMAATTEARYEGMKDYVDYTKAYEDDALTKDDYFNYPVYTSNGSNVYNDFDMSDTTANFEHVYAQIHPYMVNKTVVKAYDEAIAADDAANALVLTDKNTRDGLVKPDTEAVAATYRADILAEAAAKAAYENVDTNAIKAQAAIDYPVKDIAPLGARAIDMKPYFGYANSIIPGGYSNNGSIVIAKYMAVMEDALSSSDYQAATANLRYPVTYPDVYSPVGVNNATWAASASPMMLFYGDYPQYPYVGVSRENGTDVFKVNTPAGRIHQVFFGGNHASNPVEGEIDSTEHVTMGIYGILDHIGEDANIYGLFRDNDEDSKIARAKWGVVYTLDSLKYATSLTAAKTAMNANETNIAADLVALKGYNAIVTPTTAQKTAYNASLLGKADTAKFYYDASKLKFSDDTAALADATAELESSQAGFTSWLASGWDGKIVRDVTIDGHSFAGGMFDTNQYSSTLAHNRVDTLLNHSMYQLAGLFTDTNTGTGYASTLFDAIVPYSGKNGFVLDPVRIPGASPKAWREFLAFMEQQETAYDNYTVPTPATYYANLADAEAVVPTPSLFLTRVISGSGPYNVAFSKNYSSFDYNNIKVAIETYCEEASGQGIQLATADSLFWAQNLLRAYQSIVDSLTGVVAADVADTVARHNTYGSLVDQINAKMKDAYDNAVEYIGEDGAGAEPAYIAHPFDAASNYGTVQIYVKGKTFVPVTRAYFTTGIYGTSVYEGDAGMPEGTDGYHFAFEGAEPYLSESVEDVSDVVAPYDAIEGIPTAELYYICWNNQAGNTTGINTIGDAASGIYGVSGYTSASYYYKINSANIAYNYCPNSILSIASSSLNRGFVAAYPYLLGDNRAHAIQLQDYNPDFYASFNAADGWCILLKDNFQQAVYYKMIYDLSVMGQLDGTIEHFQENLVRFRARVDEMYAAFQADSTTGSQAYIAAKVLASNKAALKTAWDDAIAATAAAKTAYDHAVAALGSEDDAASNSATASYWAKYNYWDAKYDAAVAAEEVTAAALKVAQKAAFAAAGECWTKWNELVKPEIDKVNDASAERDRLATLYTVYGNAYNLAEGNGNSFLYPVWVWNHGSFAKHTEIRTCDDIYELYGYVNAYVKEAVTMYQYFISMCNDQISSDQDAIAQVNAAIDEDAVLAALQGYYNNAQLAIEAQKVVVADAETANDQAKLQYELAKSQLNTFLTNLGKDNVQ